METNTDRWQGLMNRAYDRWKEHEEWDYDRMLMACDGRERVAVLLGNLNYQVNNGGFQQWVDNGYALKGKEIIATLVTVANEVGSPILAELAGRIDELLEHVDLKKKNKGWNNYWLKEKGYAEDEDDYCEGVEIANSMDNWFYEKAEPRLVAAVEKWLKQTEN